MRGPRRSVLLAGAAVVAIAGISFLARVIVDPDAHRPKRTWPSAHPRPFVPPADASIERWHRAVTERRGPQAVLEAQAELQARGDEVRGPLERLATVDPDPRIRAFTVTLLAGFAPPPPERFFVERLRDESPFPREAALAALESKGTGACVAEAERVAASDPEDRLRALAARVALAARSR